MTSELAVVGVDPGARWTAGVLRVGEAALWGWTIGPLTKDGVPAPITDVDDLDGMCAYADRIVDMIDATVEQANQAGYPQVRIGIEAMRVPIGWRNGQRTRIALLDWLVPRCVSMAVRSAYPNARWVPPGGHGSLPFYPFELRVRGARPESWPRNEARRGERDHERAAYDIAGVAARVP